MTEPTHKVYAGGYVVVPNDSVNDERLSFRARGLLAYMLARPPGWQFSAQRLSRITPDGPYAVRMALQELRHHGYYRTTRRQVDNGRFITITEVAATPDLMPPPTEVQLPNVGPPNIGGPNIGPPNVGKPHFYVTTDKPLLTVIENEVGSGSRHG